MIALRPSPPRPSPHVNSPRWLHSSACLQFSKPVCMLPAQTHSLVHQVQPQTHSLSASNHTAWQMANGNAWRCLANCLQCFCPSLEMALQISTCPDCEGAGERATPCNTCGGDGRVRRTKKINLNVPPGVDNGSRLRVRGEGSAGRKGGQSCLPARTAVALFCCC